MKKSLEPRARAASAAPARSWTRSLRASIARTGELALAGGANLATRLVDGSSRPPTCWRPVPGETPKDVVVRVGAAGGRDPRRPGAARHRRDVAGSALIRELLDAGLRVGVTAQSHAVVLNLLDEVGRPAWHKDGANVEEGDEADERDRPSSATRPTTPRSGRPSRAERRPSSGAPPGCGRATTWSMPSTCSSSTRQASSRWPTPWPWRRPRARSSCSATRNS